MPPFCRASEPRWFLTRNERAPGVSSGLPPTLPGCRVWSRRRRQGGKSAVGRHQSKPRCRIDPSSGGGPPGLRSLLTPPPAGHPVGPPGLCSKRVPPRARQNRPAKIDPWSRKVCTCFLGPPNGRSLMLPGKKGERPKPPNEHARAQGEPLCAVDHKSTPNKNPPPPAQRSWAIRMCHPSERRPEFGGTLWTPAAAGLRAHTCLLGPWPQRPR